MNTVTIEAHHKIYSMVARKDVMTKFMRRGVPYEAPLLEWIYGKGFQGTAVDVGANTGNHALWFNIVCGLRVEAFEPVWYRELEQNLYLNHVGPNVRVHAMALGRVPTLVSHAGRGVLVPGGEISCQTLDFFELDNVSVIKIDVEGMEPDVLTGGRATIRRCQPVIYAESHVGMHERIAEILEPMGYEMTTRFSAESLSPRTKWKGAAMEEWWPGRS